MDSCALKWLPNIVKGEMQLGLGKYRVVKELVAQSCPAFSPHHPLHHTAAPGPPGCGDERGGGGRWRINRGDRWQDGGCGG